MSKNLYGICAGVLVSFLANNALADDSSLYLQGLIGGSRMDAWHIQNTLASTSKENAHKKHFQDTSIAYGGAIGYTYGGLPINVRGAAEYVYRSSYTYNPNPAIAGGSESMKSHVKIQTVLGDLYVDFPVMPMMDIFFGGGAGVAFNRTDAKTINGATILKDKTDRADFSWMSTAGLAIKLTDWFAIDASYRYSDLGSIAWNVASVELGTNNVWAHEVFVGFRIMPMTSSSKYPKPDQKPAYRQAPPAQPMAQPVAPRSSQSDMDAERMRRMQAEKAYMDK